ncbi:MAG: site-specific integrase [Halieaceae bacterium]|jgi:integrase|nr:site-specific integrase [Halieaceae bacterium]
MPRKRKRRDQDGLYKRDDSPYWWVSFVNERGARVRCSTRTTDRKEAEARYAKWKLDVYRARAWKEEPQVSFEQVILEYLQTHAGKRSADVDKLHAAQWRKSIAGTVMSQLAGKDISEHIRRRQQEGVGPASINRELALLSSAINHWNLAFDANLPNPTRGRKLREPEGRVRWLTRAQAAALVQGASQADQAPYLGPLIVLALNTGMRRGELLGLEWSRVDSNNAMIHLEAMHTKAGRRRGVPLNRQAQDALLVLKRYRATHCPSSRWVICRADGERIYSVATGFRNACARAGITDFRFHDLRHTCAAWLVQSGVPLTQVRDVLGHSTVTMTERYAHLAPDNIRTAVAALDGNIVTESHERVTLDICSRLRENT